MASIAVCQRRLTVLVNAFVIPGLSMHASEIPTHEGHVVLDNPEVGQGPKMPRQYLLEDVAAIHLKTIATLITFSQSITLIGMSMGGMILSILASRYRALLPKRCRFVFLVTSPNTSDCEAVPDGMLKEWLKAEHGNVEAFTRVLNPFFSTTFKQQHPNTVRRYYQYRANGENQQSKKAFMRQLTALRKYSGEDYFTQLNGDECWFIGGQQDDVLGPKHNQKLKQLAPSAHHYEASNLGHMINIEQPNYFSSQAYE